jgi:plastocyanin
MTDQGKFGKNRNIAACFSQLTMFLPVRRVFWLLQRHRLCLPLSDSLFCYLQTNTWSMKTIRLLFGLILFGSHAGAQTCEALFSFDNTNLTIQFTDLSTHANGDPIVSWDWNFDDGGSSTQQNPTHTFPEADRYDVNLTIETQSGCTSNIEIRIEICDLDIDYSLGVCNAQGEIPVTLNINDLFDNAQEVDVILDGQSVPGSPFLISGQNPVNIQVLVPGNGLSHTILVQSLDIETCGRSVTFTVDDCGSDCFLSALNVSYAPGATHIVQVDDNFFSPQSTGIILGDIVRFTWAGGGHSTTSDATTGPDSWNSGVIGAGSTFDVNIHNPGTHNYYCIPHGGIGGVGMSGQILSNCPTGTSTDIQINFNTTVANAQGFNVLWDNVAVAGSPFSYNGTGAQSVSISIAGDGMPHNLIVRDVADPTCDLDLIYTAPDCGQGGGNPTCSISGAVGSFGVCSNMNVSANLVVTVANGGTGFNVSIDGGANMFFAYTGNTTNVSITLPGNGANHTVEITDNGDPACTAVINVVTPDCNLPCSISNLTASASSGGGPSGIVHHVSVEDFQFNPGSISITVGDVVQWTWTGAIAHTATSDVATGINSWDSGLLNNGASYTSPLLEEGTHPYYCVPHGAPGGIGMSGAIQVLPACNSFGQTTVLVQFSIVNGGASGYTILVDGNNAGTFPYVPGPVQSASVLVAGDGASHTITVQDILDMACTANVGVVTPDCSGGGNPSCMVSLSPANTGVCINNMVPVLLNVTGMNTDTTYTVTVDGQPAGTFYYNNPNAQVNIAGDGLSHTIIVTDGVDPACKDTAILSTPDCALPCSISINQFNFGNNVTHIVEVQDFQFAPSSITINLGDTLLFQWTGAIPHTVTSDLATGPNAFNSGLLGQGSAWQLIPNTTGSFPYYCIPHGAPGGIGMSGTIEVTSSCNNGMANGSLTINYTNASVQGFIVTQDGTPISGSPFAYSPSGQLTIPVVVNGDGGTHTYVVSDAGNSACSAQQVQTVPNCGTTCSISNAMASVSVCNGNTVTLSASFASNQVMGAFNIYKDGLRLNVDPLITDANGNGSYTGMISGNNSTAQISFQFIENAMCTDTISVVVPSCGDPCIISDFRVGERGVTHTVEVRDFSFHPAQLEVLIGDTVRFVWTGNVPHTTTSDAFMGPNTWNSGLLGQGAVYDVVIQATGAFPYYCQPHGGPGGIGMSGSINVTDTCAQEQWRTNMSFTISAGSPLGYNVYVDGVKITPVPLLYDQPVGFNEEIISLPGDGAWHLVTIQDMETAFCAFTKPVQTSVCGVGCSVLNMTANTGTDILHTIQVRDFDYSPAQLTIHAGERIQFVWTGAIPHTVTSDALTGPEVWDSGLLGNGAVYELVISTPGTHPYFCIPHGGPGGIGMAGSITVLPACTDNQESVQLKFEVTNGSQQGYTVFVDGVPYGSNPRVYSDPMGVNESVISYPADQAQHIVTIQDVDNPVCAASDFFVTGTCSATCQISGLEYILGNGRRHEVLVRDFDFEPALLQVELGDTIHFNWTGAIPHTVTADAATGENAFNSGLLGQGSGYDLVITAAGTHPYYCIPHGAPGGIGMAGSIVVTDPCDDVSVYVDFEFFASGPGASYDVLNQGSPVINDMAYLPGGIQHFTLELAAQGESYTIQVIDNGPDDCQASVALDSLDCSDPCFLVRSDFVYDINYSTLEVVFGDESRGDIVAWQWDFGDGGTSTIQHPQHTFAEAILYQVCLTVTDINGCVAQHCDKLRLGADVCNASYTYAQDGLSFLFYNSSDVSNPEVTALWSFGDGGSSVAYDSATHLFASGLFEVCITVTSPACEDTYCEMLDLTDPCLALRAGYIATVEPGNPLLYQFTDLSSGPVGSRLWGFGDGKISTEVNPGNLYATAGVYTVCLLTIDVDGNCTNSDCRSLYVGTTSLGPGEIQLRKLILAPNPVSMWAPTVQLSGFDVNDIGMPAAISIVDVNGIVVKAENISLRESVNLSSPQMSGLYYLQVVSARNRYGAMLLVQ